MITTFFKGCESITSRTTLSLSFSDENSSASEIWDYLVFVFKMPRADRNSFYIRWTGMFSIEGFFFKFGSEDFGEIGSLY